MRIGKRHIRKREMLYAGIAAGLAYWYWRQKPSAVNPTLTNAQASAAAAQIANSMPDITPADVARLVASI